MKYILTATLSLSIAAASAQQQVKVIRTAYTPVQETRNVQSVLDRLQAESQNTVVYPLVAMTKAALSKAQSLSAKQKKDRIRTNNTKPKRVVNPNRA